jgi:ribosome biogenesis SPOUT family RNA methylase Rps3
MSTVKKTYVVEHLDPELGPWSALEYQAIAEETAAAGSSFCLSSVPPSLSLPKGLVQTAGVAIEPRGVEEIYASDKDRVCLLDPSATLELSPDDSTKFDVFLFGGILGNLGV